MMGINIQSRSDVCIRNKQITYMSIAAFCLLTVIVPITLLFPAVLKAATKSDAATPANPAAKTPTQQVVTLPKTATTSGTTVISKIAASPKVIAAAPQTTPDNIPYGAVPIYKATPTIEIVPYGNITSRAQADGTNVFICTGGIYVYQHMPQQDTTVELRADNAVIFYSGTGKADNVKIVTAKNSAGKVIIAKAAVDNGKNPTRAHSGVKGRDKTNNNAKDNTSHSQTTNSPALRLQQLARYIKGIYLEGNVTLQANRPSPAQDIKITAKKLYYDLQKNKALILDGLLRLNTENFLLPFYVQAREIYQKEFSFFTARDASITNDEFYEPHTSLRARLINITAQKQPTLLVNSTTQTPQSINNNNHNSNNTNAAHNSHLSNTNNTSGGVTRYKYNMQDVTLNVGKLPLFWWPRAAGVTSRNNIPVKSLHTSYGSEYGATLESQWDLPWLMGKQAPKGTTATLHLDEYTKRGPGGGVDLDYRSRNYFGLLRSYIISDHGRDRLASFDSRRDVEPTTNVRGRIRWQHRQFLPDNWQATFEISYLSDRDFLESWREREFDTDKGQETLAYFKQQRDNWAFDILNKFNLNDFDYTLTELPSLGYHLAGASLFDMVTYNEDTTVSRLRQHTGHREVPGWGSKYETSMLRGTLDQDDFAFVTSRHELFIPMDIGPFHIAPTAIGTYVHDESQFYGSPYGDPRYSGQPSHNDFVYGAAGLRASTQLWHINNSAHSRVFNINRIRHIIIPEVSTFWVASSMSEVVRRNVFNFALKQRWQTMRGPSGQQRSVDFLRLNTSLTLVNHDVDNPELPSEFFFSTPDSQFNAPAMTNTDLVNLGMARRQQFNLNYSDHANANLEWQISDATVFTSYLNYNLHDGAVSQADGTIAVQHSPRTRYYISDRYLRYGDPLEDGNAQFLTVGMSYQLNRKYTIALSHQYDLANTAVAYNRATIIRKISHWYAAFSISHNATRDGVSFIMSFWPEGYNQIALGTRRFTHLVP